MSSPADRSGDPAQHTGKIAALRDEQNQSATVRIELPAHLCLLAKVPRQLALAVAAPITQRSILDALESAYPMLKGTIRDHTTGTRRPFLRFFACQQDLSHLDPDEVVPEAVSQGREIYLILGAIAGG